MTGDQINAFGVTGAALISAACHGAAIVIKAWKAKPAAPDDDKPDAPPAPAAPPKP